MTEELMRCPMCGGEAHLTKGHCTGPQWPGEFHRVYCGSCQLRQLFHSTPSEAIAAWNTRAPSASIADTAGAKPTCVHAENPKACYRVRCQLGNKCVDDDLSFRAPPAPSVADAAGASDKPLTDAQIEAGWRQTFSTENPYCPCNLKSFTKAVRWAEHAKESGND